jgi:hypothetical protein
VVEQAQYTHYQDHKMLMAKINKLHNEVHTTQIEVQKLQLQVNIEWEITILTNQTKVKLYDQLI